MDTVIDITTAATTEPGEKFSLMAKHAETVWRTATIFDVITPFVERKCFYGSALPYPPRLKEKKTKRRRKLNVKRKLTLPTYCNALSDSAVIYAPVKDLLRAIQSVTSRGFCAIAVFLFLCRQMMFEWDDDGLGGLAAGTGTDSSVGVRCAAASHCWVDYSLLTLLTQPASVPYSQSTVMTQTGGATCRQRLTTKTRSHTRSPISVRPMAWFLASLHFARWWRHQALPWTEHVSGAAVFIYL